MPMISSSRYLTQLMTTGPHRAAASGRVQADGPRPTTNRFGHWRVPRDGVARLRWLLPRLALGGAALQLPVLLWVNDAPPTLRWAAGVVLGLLLVTGVLYVWTGARGRPEAMTVRDLRREGVASAAREESGRQQSIAERARMEGALLVVRTVAHEVNNDLSPIAGFAELLALHPAVAHDPTAMAYAHQIHVSALAAAATVLRLQRLVRLEEAPSALGAGWSVLDLERSTTPDSADSPAL